MADRYGRNLHPELTKLIDDQLASDKWYVQTIPGHVTGIGRDIEVIRGHRTVKTMLTFDWHGDRDTFCPPLWWDLAIGAGACNFSCRHCFLLLSHRAFNDPLRHRLYDNVEDYYDVIAKWLKATEWPYPNIKGKIVKLTRNVTLGLGIDRSDSLLYEGVTGHARRLIPLFVNPDTNPQGRRLILLTKSANAHYLDWRSINGEFAAFGEACARYAGQTIPNVSVTFSMNPDMIADQWEGKFPDTGQRITPHIDRRLEAVQLARSLGFETRWRLDPILPVEGWPEIYREWLIQAVEKFDAQPSYITLGTYREKNNQLDTWREKWGLLPSEYRPGNLALDGTHWHLPEAARADIYGLVRDTIRAVWGERGRPIPAVSLCKESHSIRRVLNLCNAECNCLQ
jgi:hypothetical protein